VEKLFECTDRISIAARRSSIRSRCFASGLLSMMEGKEERGGNEDEVPLSKERMS
jgi:hypothetical protein